MVLGWVIEFKKIARKRSAIHCRIRFLTLFQTPLTCKTYHRVCMVGSCIAFCMSVCVWRNQNSYLENGLTYGSQIWSEHDPYKFGPEKASSAPPRDCENTPCWQVGSHQCQVASLFASLTFGHIQTNRQKVMHMSKLFNYTGRLKNRSHKVECKIFYSVRNKALVYESCQ